MRAAAYPLEACPDAAPEAVDHVWRHRAGRAWTDLGTAHVVSGRSGDWSESVRCHKRAVEVLGGLPVAEDDEYLADLGAAWVNLGCALQAVSSPESLREALDALDRGIELLGGLPVRSSTRFRHNLAAAWMNKADAMARLDARDSRSGALDTYGRAIEIAGGLPLDEKPSFRVLLASCWINRGNLHLRLLDFPGALRAYDEALAGIGSLPQSGHRLACHHAATAWTNRAEALLSQAAPDGALAAVESAGMALATLEGRDLGGATDAKLILRALRAKARGLEALMGGGNAHGADRICALSDLAEQGMALALANRNAAPEVFDPFIDWFFSFGSRAYGRHQPQFLAEYLEETLRRPGVRACRALGAGLRAIARSAAVDSLKGLGRNRLLVQGAPQTECLMRTVRELRVAVARYHS
jgi:tetratricopeptide (TPR) repeat protein